MNPLKEGSRSGLYLHNLTSFNSQEKAVETPISKIWNFLKEQNKTKVPARCFFLLRLLIKQFNIFKSLTLFKLTGYQFLFDFFARTFPITILTMTVTMRSQHVSQSVWHSHFRIARIFASIFSIYVSQSIYSNPYFFPICFSIHIFFSICFTICMTFWFPYCTHLCLHSFFAPFSWFVPSVPAYNKPYVYPYDILISILHAYLLPSIFSVTFISIYQTLQPLSLFIKLQKTLLYVTVTEHP